MSSELTKYNLLEVPAKIYYNEDKRIIELIKKISQAVFEAEEITVLTQSGVESAAHYIENFKDIERTAEALRKAEKDIFFKKGQDIDSFFKTIPLMFSEVKARLEKEVMDWKRKQDKIAKEKADEERKILEEEAIQEAIKKEKMLQTQAIIRGEDPAKVKVEIPIIPEVIQAPVKLSQKNTSGLTTARRKEFIIKNPKLVPPEFWIIDEAKIKAERMKFDFEAKSNIPGVEFTYSENLR